MPRVRLNQPKSRFFSNATSLLSRALTHDGFRKYFANTGWLFAARIVTYAVSFFTIAFVARYLGPENFGKLSYAQSFVALFSLFASLGIDSILYRNLVTNPRREHELLGTAVIAKIGFGFVALVIASASAFVFHADAILSALIFAISLTFIFQPFAAINHLVGARVQSKYYAYITIFVALVLSGLKLLLIYLNEGILYFAILIAFEAALYSLLYIVLYIKRFNGHPWLWRFSFPVLFSLLRDSWPLFLAGFAGILYARIDQIVIQHFLGPASVGMYDAAVRLTEIWVFIPSLIIGSLFPAVANARETDPALYSRRLRALTLFTTGAILAIVLPLSIFAPYVVQIVFGNEFYETASVLSIYAWSGLGITAVALMQNYLVIENRASRFFLITFAGAASNILLNLELVPHLGMQGAAIATLVSYGVMMCTLFLFRDTRRGLWMIIGSR